MSILTASPGPIMNQCKGPAWRVKRGSIGWRQGHKGRAGGFMRGGIFILVMWGLYRPLDVKDWLTDANPVAWASCCCGQHQYLQADELRSAVLDNRVAQLLRVGCKRIAGAVERLALGGQVSVPQSVEQDQGLPHRTGSRGRWNGNRFVNTKG